MSADWAFGFVCGIALVLTAVFFVDVTRGRRD